MVCCFDMIPKQGFIVLGHLNTYLWGRIKLCFSVSNPSTLALLWQKLRLKGILPFIHIFSFQRVMDFIKMMLIISTARLHCKGIL